MGGVDRVSPVGVAVFGVSAPFAHFGFHVVCRVIEAVAGATVNLHVADVRGLHDGFAKRQGGSVVVISDFPDADFARFVCDSDLPLIVFSDSVADTLEWVLKSRGLGVIDSIRLCTRLFSCLALPLTSERALLLHDGPGQTSQNVVRSIVEHVFPGRGEAFAEATFRRLVDAGLIPGGVIVDRSHYHLSERELEPGDLELLQQVERLSVGYEELLAGRWPSGFFWPLELFARLDEGSPTAPLELAGPARGLLYGPYLHLPVGEWAVRLEFEIDDAESGVEATTDVFINEVIIEKTFFMPVKGIYAYELKFRVDDPHLPVQVRLFANKSAIEGVFLPRSVRVRSLASLG